MNIGNDHDFSEAMQIDQAIYQLAAYDTARGLILMPDSAEQAMDMQKDIAKRFNYFKRLIQNSEISFSELHRTIVEKNGPYPNKQHNLTTEQMIEDVIKNPKPQDPIDEEAVQSATSILQRLFEDVVVQMSGLNSGKTSEQGRIKIDDIEETSYKPNPFKMINKSNTTSDIPNENITENKKIKKPKANKNKKQK